MNKKVLLEILKSKPMTFTAEEIYEIMNEELNKDPSEMDTDLVDLCADILDGGNDDAESAKEVMTGKKVKKIRKVFLAAAIILLSAAIAVPAFGRHTAEGSYEGIIKYYPTYYKVNLRNYNAAPVQFDLFEEYEKGGLENLHLPKELLKKKYLKDVKFSTQTDFKNISVSFNKEDSEIIGVIDMTEYGEKVRFALYNLEIPADFYKIKLLQRDDTIILVDNNDKTTCIFYVIGNTSYSISLDNCSFEEGIEIAKTIK